MRNSLFAKALLIAGLLPFQSGAFAEAVPVELSRTESGWQLLRGGEPYLVRGAGGTGSLELLADAGGNSIRTWSADKLGPLLDEAHSLGLTVAVGIWLGHERHGFDYGDAQQVKDQLERAREIVLRHKDHPAVLLWGIGNEMEGFAEGNNPAIWKAVNDIAAMIKDIDPAHPTMTVTAEIGGERVKYVHEHCPAIDIHGINAYGGAASLPERLMAAGATKPYILTEFGPAGPWEVEKNEWGAALEPTSTEKAELYRRNYEQAILQAPDVALGSYAFNWGFKMEATATWFGMFLDDGSRLAAIDTMTELWSDTIPGNRAPSVEPLKIDGAATVKPSTRLTVSTVVADPDNDPVTARWILRAESGDYTTGGDFRPMLPEIEGAVIESRSDRAKIRMPEQPGHYRLFLYVHDQQGNAATANLPLRVEGEIQTRFPVVVYEDSFAGMPWAPSGWMGAIDDLTLDGDYAVDPQAGNASIKIRYTGKFGWAGIAWQDPPNNWGDRDGGYDLSGARELSLWARGAYGGEKIKIGIGLLGEDIAYPDSAITSVDDIVLTHEWQNYRIRLNKKDLSSLKTGFVITVSGRASPVTVFLDSIRFNR
ncbi:MAG: hypothetical protein KJO19_03990 [Woeseia sp.]|nr:hypothetical protein [Woeseia sp.]MBT8096170.1 hypothetical protein [Woeseia sp.]